MTPEPSRPWTAELRGAAAFLAAIGLFAGALALVQARLLPPPALPADAPADMFSATRALARLETLIGDDVPHPVGSPAAAGVRARLVAAFADIGLVAEVQEGFACGPRSASCGRVWNVVAALPGAAPGPALLLSAHHDSVAVGPGAGDDGSGVAAVLEVARALQAGPPPRSPVIFLLVDGEEAGLLGAQAFVDAHPLAATVGAAINLDAGGTRGVTSLTRTSPDDAGLIAAVAGSVPRPYGASVIGAVYGLTPYDTDFTVYRNAGWLALDLGFGEDKAHYHTPLDRLDNLDPDSVQHLGDTALAAARALADQDLAALPGGSRVYLDVLGARLVHWRAPWTPLLALPALAVLSLCAWRIRQGARDMSPRSRWRRWRWALAFPLLVGGGTAVGALLMALIAWLTGAELPGHAVPGPARAALWTAVLASAGALAGLLARGEPDARRWLWLAPWLWLAAIAAATAIAVPGASVGVLPPALVAASLALGTWRLRPGAKDMPAWAIVAALALPAVMWLQAAVRVEAIFGLGLEAAAVLSLLAALLAPLWLGLGRLRRPLVLALGVACVAATVVAATRPAYTAERPRRLSVLYHLDAGTREVLAAGDDTAAREGAAIHEATARWIVGADAPLPAALAAVADFGAAGPAFAWETDASPSYAAPATGDLPADLPPPTLTLEADTEPPPETGRRVVLRLRSPRGARVASLLLPDSADVRAVAVEGVALPPYPEHRRRYVRDAQVYTVVALPPEGVRVTLELGAPAPVEAVVWDLSEGLPEQGRALQAARPPWAVPSHGGDRTMVSTRASL